MPELPEVERARRTAQRIAARRTIRDVHAADDSIVMAGLSPRRLTRALKGRAVRDVHRRGKYLWFELDTRPWPLFHFGMAGGFHAPGETALKLASSGSKVDRSWPPRFTKIHLTFDDGGELVMTDKRRLGRVRLCDDVLNEPPINRLGFDPLLDLPSPRKFVDRLVTRSATIKAVLLDQSFAAGVGNWLADEILFQAKIDPRKRANELSETEAKRIRTAMKRIIEKACAVNAEKEKFPRTWLFHHRWGKNSEAKTSHGQRIEHITVAGRTTAWVPTVQRNT